MFFKPEFDFLSRDKRAFCFAETETSFSYSGRVNSHVLPTEVARDDVAIKVGDAEGQTRAIAIRSAQKCNRQNLIGK